MTAQMRQGMNSQQRGWRGGWERTRRTLSRKVLKLPVIAWIVLAILLWQGLPLLKEMIPAAPSATEEVEAFGVTTKGEEAVLKTPGGAIRFFNLTAYKLDLEELLKVEWQRWQLALVGLLFVCALLDALCNQMGPSWRGVLGIILIPLVFGIPSGWLKLVGVVFICWILLRSREEVERGQVVMIVLVIGLVVILTWQNRQRFPWGLGQWIEAFARAGAEWDWLAWLAIGIGTVFAFRPETEGTAYALMLVCLSYWTERVGVVPLIGWKGIVKPVSWEAMFDGFTLFVYLLRVVGIGILIKEQVTALRIGGYDVPISPLVGGTVATGIATLMALVFLEGPLVVAFLVTMAVGGVFVGLMTLSLSKDITYVQVRAVFGDSARLFILVIPVDAIALWAVLAIFCLTAIPAVRPLF